MSSVGVAVGGGRVAVGDGGGVAVTGCVGAGVGVAVVGGTAVNVAGSCACSCKLGTAAMAMRVGRGVETAVQPVSSRMKTIARIAGVMATAQIFRVVNGLFGMVL